MRTAEQPRPATVTGGPSAPARPIPVPLEEAPAQPSAARPARLQWRDLRVPAVVAAVIAAAGALVATAGGDLQTQRGAVEGLALALRVAASACVLATVGVGAFLATAHDGDPREAVRLRRLVRTAAGVGVAATVASLPLHTAVVTGAGYAGLADGSTLVGILGSSFGHAAGLRALGLAGVAWAAGRRTPAGHSAVTAATLAALASFVLTGHAATADPRWLVAGSTLVHSGAAAIWAGGLVGLAVVLRSRRAAGDAVGGAGVVGRFSTVAGISLAAVVPTGTLLGAMEIGSVTGLVTSGYGRALLVKVSLVAGLVAIGAYNRWRLVPAIRTQTPQAWARLRRTVRVELAALLVVVAATGLLGRLSPPG